MIAKERYILLSLLIVGYVVFSKYSPRVTPASPTNAAADVPNWEPINYGLGPVFKVLGGHETGWELPANGPPKAVVFFAHGCHHASGDLWPPSEACPSCLGLPEEVRIRNIILKRGYAVVGISSKDREKGCWREIKEDGGESVARVLQKIITKLDLENIPLFVMGASSGGQLALILPHVMKVDGICAEVRGVEPEALHLRKGAAYPPTAFIHMPRHEENAAQIAADIEILKAQDVPVADLRVNPRPITVEFLSSRSPDISYQMAEDIIAALKKGGFLDENDMLLEPPRPTLDKWGPFVQPVVGNLTLALDKSPVTELLNLAWAKHEATSDQLDLALEWLEGKGKTSVEYILKQRENNGS